MKYKVSIAIAVSLIFTTLVGTTLSVSAQYIQEASGRVRLRREGWSEYRVIGVPARIQVGDLLLPDPGVEVTLICHDGTHWPPPSGVPSGIPNSCFNTLGDVRGEIQYRPGGSNSQIPYTISPRMTYLLNNRPILRWNEVKGATSYTVRLQGPGLEWKGSFNSSGVVYPEDAPPLEAGVQYLMTVEANNGTSSRNDSGAILGFEVLHEIIVSDVQEKAAKIANSSESDETKAFALAELYRNEYLISDAIKTLETLVEQKSQTALVYRLLGDFYSEAGLNLLAEARYSKAIELFTASQNQYGLAETQAHLAVVKRMLGKMDEAEQLLNQAQVGYKALGDPESANELEGVLEKTNTENQQLGALAGGQILTPRDNP